MRSETDAILELFRRFLRSYGPATTGDFTHWWGSLRDEDRSALKRDREGLEEVELNGRMGLMLKHDAEEARSLGPTHMVSLLPAFGCYPMQYSPRELFIPDAYRGRVFRAAGWNYPTVVVDGHAAGIWNLKKRGRDIEGDIEPFKALDTKEKKGIEDEASDIGRFLDAAATVHF